MQTCSLAENTLLFFYRLSNKIAQKDRLKKATQRRHNMYKSVTNATGRKFIYLAFGNAKFVELEKYICTIGLQRGQSSTLSRNIDKAFWEANSQKASKRIVCDANKTQSKPPEKRKFSHVALRFGMVFGCGTRAKVVY